MNVFEILKAESSSRNLSFLLIGGHAVGAHGYSRFTADVDLLVRKQDRAEWIIALEKNGFPLLHDGQSFLQFSSPQDFRWPIDLMLVNDATFHEMEKEAKEIQIGEIFLRTPSLNHLLALKLHALKSASEGRGRKDFLDVMSLLEANAVDVRSDKFRSLCEKYGSAEIYEQFLRK